MLVVPGGIAFRADKGGDVATDALASLRPSVRDPKFS